ncbi:MAG: efflux RND transporter permease subunit, partial [Gammaproteobacteria bacterium]|nr:efflux RND transporter permease subunit [Gammaproteobacteria bacterium]
VFNLMPRDDMPPFLIRYVTIVSSFPGAGPERMEMLVSDKIEKVIQEIPEVDYITSESRTGVSVVSVSLKNNVMVLQPVFDRIRRKVEDMQGELPEGVVPVVDDEVGDVFGLIIGITADGYSYAELKKVADDVRDGLIKMPNAAKVEIVGDQEERIFIDFNDARLAELGLTKQKVQNTLAARNIIFPGGNIKLGKERIFLEPTGNFETVEDIRKTLIPIDGSNELVFLGDVTRIYRGYIDPPNSLVKINGQKGLVLGISLKKGGNIIHLGSQVDEKLNEYREIYPIGVDFIRVAYQDTEVDKSVKDFISNLMQSVGVVLMVMLIFLGLRTGLVVASLIPSTIILTILIMSLINVGLNQVTLASLIIALGMLVDNAIVMSESIMVKMEAGEKATSAAVNSSRELMVPLLVSTLTTSAAFLSFFLAESMMGEIMGNIFVVVSIALLSSWLLALTVVPILATMFLKVKPAGEKKKSVFERLREYYVRGLVFFLKKPWLLPIGIGIVFVVSLKLFSFLPFTFFPESDRPLVTANIELPIGTSIESTRSAIDDIEDFIRDNLLIGDSRRKGVMSWSSYIGQGAPKYDLGYNPPEAAPYSAHILLNTTSGAINQQVIDELDRYCFDRFPEMTATVSKLKSGGGSADPIAIRVYGKNTNKLYQIIDEIKKKLSAIPGSKNVKDDWGMRSKKIVVNVDQAKAQLAGVTSQDIAISLQTLLAGMEVERFREEDKSIPIVIRRELTGSQEIDQLESLNLYAQQSGQSVPLKQVADIQVTWEASKILRRDLYRTMTVTSQLKTGYTASEVMNQLKPWLGDAKKDWGTGYRYELGGENEDTAKAIGAVLKYLPLSFMIILLLLIGQFNSLRKPVIVLLTIPLGLIGVICGLLITRSYFSFLGFLGIISLAGIVINNGIVLLDRIKIEIEEFNMSESEAIIAAAEQRFRPILLTTATTSLGLIPLWVGGGEMWQPMAIGIIFGLLFATVITLLFVPVLYKIMFRINFNKYQKAE